MEFVIQLWAYYSERFFLGLNCPEVIKNHVWLALMLIKTTLVGCSITLLTKPNFFYDTNKSLFNGTEEGKFDTSKAFHFTPQCFDSGNFVILERYYYLQGVTMFFLLITYVRILRSGVKLSGNV